VVLRCASGRNEWKERQDEQDERCSHAPA
jgi:hypothetical protein